jgi:hypothetical protein
MLCVSEPHASKDDGPMTRRRLDGQLSVYHTEPLAHADQAYPPTIHRLMPIEPNSRVTHSQTDSVLSAVQFYGEVLRPAMLYRILQSFLKDSK